MDFALVSARARVGSCSRSQVIKAIELKGKKTVTPEIRAWAHSDIAGHGPRLYYVQMYNLK